MMAMPERLPIVSWKEEAAVFGHPAAVLEAGGE